MYHFDLMQAWIQIDERTAIYLHIFPFVSLMLNNLLVREYRKVKVEIFAMTENMHPFVPTKKKCYFTSKYLIEQMTDDVFLLMFPFWEYNALFCFNVSKMVLL